MEHYSVQMVVTFGEFIFFLEASLAQNNIFITPSRYIRGLWSHREEAEMLLRAST